MGDVIRGPWTRRPKLQRATTRCAPVCTLVVDEARHRIHCESCGRVYGAWEALVMLVGHWKSVGRGVQAAHDELRSIERQRDKLLVAMGIASGPRGRLVLFEIARALRTTMTADEVDAAMRVGLSRAGVAALDPAPAPAPRRAE